METGSIDPIHPTAAFRKSNAHDQTNPTRTRPLLTPPGISSTM
jgi:hypothetical protein